MRNYIYPAVFRANKDGSYTITFPDLPGCISEAKNLDNALRMAQSALSQWLLYLSDKQQVFPLPSHPNRIATAPNEFVSLIRTELRDERAVRRTVSIPKWMDEEVIKAGLSLSRILQDTLKKQLGHI